MLTYSVAIRTLGLSVSTLKEELLSIAQQTIQPERVLIYIAKGYERPGFTIGCEEYVWVEKGMLAQRALPYTEITSGCILLLDDDVRLNTDSAERMLKAMERYDADCVGADVFSNHEMSLKNKLYALAVNLVHPHHDENWAFKIHRNGSFSYIAHPTKSFYWSQSCSGPAALWKKDTLIRLHLEDERWIDTLGFAYGEDALTYYKLYRNGYKLGILFDAGIHNLNAGTSSSIYRKAPQRMYIRTKAMFLIWHRSLYLPASHSLKEKTLTVIAFTLKLLWMFPMVCAAAMLSFHAKSVVLYFKGIYDGWKFTSSTIYRTLPNYLISHS